MPSYKDSLQQRLYALVSLVLALNCIHALAETLAVISLTLSTDLMSKFIQLVKTIAPSSLTEHARVTQLGSVLHNQDS